MKKVTAIVISFLRPGYTTACITSLRERYPEINIVVGENGHRNEELAQTCKEIGARYIQLPYDSGVCVGRNTLLKNVETPYVLVGDDDFFYTETAKADEMVAFLEAHPEFDQIGGRVSENGIIRNYQGYTERRTNHIHVHALDLEKAEYQTHGALRYCPADLTFNYFVARAEAVKAVPWDEEIKVAYEHLSWFLDFKAAGYKSAFTPDAIVVHKPGHVDPKEEQEYRAFRMRRSDKERFFKRFNIDYTIGMNGAKDYKPNHVVERRKNDTKYIDFCITTFKRPEALKRLLLSIAEHYPMANVYVGDQNETLDREFYKQLRSDVYDAGLLKRIVIEHLPYDCGLSYARNHLVLTTPNQYKLILDDDMVFTKETDIGKMVSLMETGNSVGIVGGLVRQLGYDIHFEFTPEIEGDTIVHRTERQIWRSHNNIRYRKTGCVLNFALMRKDLFTYIQWDHRLKVTEHTDFYLRMKQTPYQILYTPDVVVEHPPTQRTDGYKQLRQRDEFQVMMLKKWGMKKMRYENGQVIELMPDDSLRKYKEKV